MAVEAAQGDHLVGRTLFGWVLPRFLAYIAAAVGSAALFLAWAALYTYVWPGRPTHPLERPAPRIERPSKPSTPDSIQLPSKRKTWEEMLIADTEARRWADGVLSSLRRPDEPWRVLTGVASNVLANLNKTADAELKGNSKQLKEEVEKSNRLNYLVINDIYMLLKSDFYKDADAFEKAMRIIQERSTQADVNDLGKARAALISSMARLLQFSAGMHQLVLLERMG